MILFFTVSLVNAEPKVDFKLQSLEQAVTINMLEADLAQAFETIRVMQSWLDAKFNAIKTMATKESKAALTEYKDILETKKESTDEKPSDSN
ncbi:MAG: hypothetical protein DRQ47_06015 [Gammaproteobacteria bacterium]|nr:MAG: hypothetical protein DRQ47_06015 [Gammaproteobacteria bacterium]